MSYFYFVLSLIAGATKGFCGKKTSGYVEGYRDAMLVNLIRMLCCILIGFVITLMGGGLSSFIVDGKALGIVLLSGVSSFLFVVTWLICVKRGAYMMMDVFLMMGTAIPLLGSSLFLQEKMSARQWIGIAVLVIACFIMCSYNNSIKGKLSFASLGLLVFCGAACGFSDFSQKLFVSLVPSGSVGAFNFYSYIVSACCLLLCYLIASCFAARSRSTEDGAMAAEKKPLAVIRPIFGYVLVMAVCLFANSFFQTKAAAGIPSATLFPLSKSCSLVLASLMASVFFKEKLTVKCVVGMAVAFVGLLIINL